MINVHILDPTSREEVTHIVPPPIPMDAYEYIGKRLPFFVVNEQIDDRLDGGGFEDIKSVSQMDEDNGANSEPRLIHLSLLYVGLAKVDCVIACEL
jgi:hypothetical protein